MQVVGLEKLSQNYRSTQKILNASYAIISKNSTHPVLELWTENQGGEELMLFEARNEHNEADFIVEQIASIKYQQRCTYIAFDWLFIR